MRAFTQENLPHSLKVYRRTGTVRAIKMNVEFETVTIEGNTAGGRAGDYLCVDSEGYPYPCNAAVFERAHEPVDNPRGPGGTSPTSSEGAVCSGSLDD